MTARNGHLAENARIDRREEDAGLVAVILGGLTVIGFVAVVVGVGVVMMVRGLLS